MDDYNQEQYHKQLAKLWEAIGNPHYSENEGKDVFTLVVERIEKLEEENTALQGSYNAAMRRIDLLERGRER